MLAFPITVYSPLPEGVVSNQSPCIRIGISRLVPLEMARKILQSILVASLLITLLSTPVAAQNRGTESCADMPPQFEQISELLTRLQQLGVAFGLLLGVLMYIWAGINWMRGTPDAQQRAKRVFWNTSVGIVIVLMSGGLIEFVKSVLGCGGV